MMAWRDQLSIASFRGIVFQVEAATTAIGRRLARHEYPQRDTPWMEDMGRKAREYKVDAYILGADYMQGRDQLILEIEKAGAGLLVHPYYGTVNVTVSDCQISESNQHGGMVKFSLTFVEAGEQNEPGAQTDTEGELTNQLDACNATIAQDFSESFSLDDVNDFALQDALDFANDLLQQLQIGIQQYEWIRSDPLTALNALLPENIQAALGNPIDFANGVIALMGNMDNLGLLLDGDDNNDPTVTPGAGVVRTKTESNRVALHNLVQHLATAQQVVNLALTDHASLDDARAAQTEILLRVDDVMFDTTSAPATVDAMLQLRTLAAAHFIRTQITLPKLLTLRPQTELPALVHAHALYGDAWLEQDREAEVIRRNHVRHPLFVPAGRDMHMVLPA
jgi:prophage DNA circulation protein